MTENRAIEMLRMALLEDAEYSADNATAFIDRKTGDVFFQYETLEESERAIGPACNDDWRKHNMMLHTEPDRFVKIEKVSHGQWHKVFLQWLESIGKADWYQNSIGRTLEDMTEDEWQEWQSYRFEWAENRARAVINRL